MRKSNKDLAVSLLAEARRLRDKAAQCRQDGNAQDAEQHEADAAELAAEAERALRQGGPR